jgi:hypothetical protein
MYEEWATSGPCTTTITDLLYFPFDEPFINPTHRMNCRALLMGASNVTWFHEELAQVMKS